LSPWRPLGWRQGEAWAGTGGWRWSVARLLPRLRVRRKYLPDAYKVIWVSLNKRRLLLLLTGDANER